MAVPWSFMLLLNFSFLKVPIFFAIVSPYNSTTMLKFEVTTSFNAPLVLCAKVNEIIFMYAADTFLDQGRIQDFLKGGSESGVDIEGGANPSIVSLKQGVWAPQKLWGI